MIVEVDEIQKQISRAFDVSGGFSTSVATSVSPTLPVGAAALPPYDTAFRYARGDTVTGDATHPGLYVIENPSNFSQWVVIDELWLTCQAAVQNFQLALLYEENNAPPLNIEAVFPPNIPGVDTDSRQRSRSPAPLVSTNRIFSVNNQTVVGQANSIVVATVRGAVDTPFPVPICPVILAPNVGLMIGGTVNAATWLVCHKARVFEVRQK